jgi:hypothetical protein
VSVFSLLLIFCNVSPKILPRVITKLGRKTATYNLNKYGEQQIRIILPMRLRRAYLQSASVPHRLSVHEFGKLKNDQESSIAWLMDYNVSMSDEIMIDLYG